jgi:hypothetical protein
MSVWREVQETLYQRWAGQWVTDDLVPVELTPYLFDNDPTFDPPDGQWVEFSVRRAGATGRTLGNVGNRKIDRRGLLMIVLREPPGSGVGGMSDLAERAARIFENCRLEPHDIRFEDVEPTFEGMLEDGRWWGVVIEGAFDYEDIV